MMKHGIILLLSVQLLMEAAAEERKKNATTQGFAYLGSVDGKMYFTDDGIRNWRDSRQYCISMNMELATINTDNQAAFLQTKYNDGLRPGFAYWLGARDAMEPRALSWDYTDAPLEELVSLDWNNEFEILDKICGVYMPSPTAELLMYPCGENVYNFCLCQAVQ